MNMAENLKSLPFSTRLRTVLIRYADFPHRRDYTFESIIEEYRKSPVDFEAEFLRVPGAGRMSLYELINFLDSIGDDGNYAGRTVLLRRNQAVEAKQAIAEACHYISTESALYKTLRDLERWLEAGTIHIEQLNDGRSVFKDHS